MIEYMMDILWMALAAMPFAVGTARPRGLNARNIAASTRAVSGANQASFASDILAGLNTMTDMGETLNASQLKTLRGQSTKGDARIKELESAIGKSRNPKKIAKWQAELNKLTTAKTERDTKISTLASPDFAANKLRGTFGEQFGMRDNIVSSLGASLSPTSEYNRMQDAFGRGVTAQQADMERVAAQETDQGQLGARLMQEAMTKMDQGGQLSPEAQRDAVQSARQGFASRGMATGNAALGAELLNRDRFARQREFQNLGFAQSVEAADLARRSQNTLNRQQAGMQNAQAFNNLSQFNTLQRDNTNRFNIGLLGQSAALADQERLRQSAVRQDQYNFSMATDPRMMAMTLGQPYSNLTGSTQAGLGVGTFNQNMQASMFNSDQNNRAALQAAGMQAGAMNNAATMGMIGNIAGGLFQGAGLALSDKREKKDIKPLGKAGSVLGLTAYEFTYKGDDKKHKGFMAQDVKKVLPEAVAEVDYKGKKRLAIKPAVIGAALAEELMAAKAA
jgi:hypothetical protein